ncbi:MAG: polysaccharide biosynthesis protein [Williamsia sp.]|nr:polysaccharide biosynthesis protein [Williamsia sp.]
MNINRFIAAHVTGRKQSLFAPDLETYKPAITKEVEGKSVLVIGGAGTIGSSFIKALLVYKPRKLVVVDINENGLTELVRDCRSNPETVLPADFKSYPINFGDPVFKKMFRAEAPFHIVANFAAHKHVRSEKDPVSIEAMIDNNVLKAKELLDLLLTSKPEHFFCVSTDKAANPVNIMGASKKLMEEIVLAYSAELNITTARFANVAFSNGSLLAGFIERMMKQQPLSCPSDVKRYFVSPQESGEICLMACVLGESGDIFFPQLDPGKDLVRFADIARSFLQYIGLQEDICQTEQEARTKKEEQGSGKYPVYYFESETTGEKLFEEFFTEEEHIITDKFAALGIIKNAARRNKGELDRIVADIKRLFERGADKAAIVQLLQILLPNFQHTETGMNLDQKM